MAAQIEAQRFVLIPELLAEGIFPQPADFRLRFLQRGGGEEIHLPTLVDPGVVCGGVHGLLVSDDHLLAGVAHAVHGAAADQVFEHLFV